MLWRHQVGLYFVKRALFFQFSLSELTVPNGRKVITWTDDDPPIDALWIIGLQRVYISQYTVDTRCNIDIDSDL